MMEHAPAGGSAAPTIAVDRGDPRGLSCDVVVVGAFTGGIEGPGVAPVLDGLGLAALPVTPDFRGDIGQHLLLAGPGLPWAAVLFVGLGRMVATDANRLREAATVAAATGHLRGRVVTTLALVHPTADAVAAVAEGFHLARRPPHRADPPTGTPTAEITILVPTALVADGRAAAARGATMAHATLAARDLVDTPPNHRPPSVLADRLAGMAAASCDADLHDGAALGEAGFGGTLSAGRGAGEDPCLLELRYEPEDPLGHVVLCGRGATFGSGGLALRRGAAMEAGKADVAGAAVIAAACGALRELGVRIRVTALLGLLESMPGGDAQRPGDVVTTRGGLTIEVVDPAADAVLVLADLIDLARAYEPDAIVDVTTVGAAATAALGDGAGAVLGTDASLVDGLLAAAGRAGEPLWQLPLWDHHERWLDSAVADVVNRRRGVGGDAITAGLLLRRVAREVPWAHLDLGGAAFLPPATAGDERRSGATGFGARTMAAWLEHRTTHAG